MQIRFLMDVNVLVALGLFEHEFHERVARWIEKETPLLATCSISELGFARILSQVGGYAHSVAEARAELIALKQRLGPRNIFLDDTNDINDLPIWVKSPKQITDGHLIELARIHGMSFATMDEHIPGAFVIPKL